MGFDSALEDKFLPHPQPHWTDKATNNFWTNTPGSSCSNGNTGRETSLFSERKNHCYHPTRAQSLSRVRLFAMLWTMASRLLWPWDFQARKLEWVAIFFSRRSSWSRIKPSSPALQVDYLPLSHLRSLILYFLFCTGIPSPAFLIHGQLSGPLFKQAQWPCEAT